MAYDPWNPPPQRVQFRLQPASPPSDDAKFLLIDDARGGFVCGTLILNSDELKVMQFALSSVSGEPGVNTNFEQYMRIRVVENPMNYVINGKRLDQVPLAERWNLVYATYRANLPSKPYP